MMCQRIGRPPISIMGLGRSWLSSEIRVPSPPASITTFVILAPPASQCFAKLLHEIGKTRQPATAKTLRAEDRLQLRKSLVHVLVDDDVIVFLVVADFVRRLGHSRRDHIRRVLGA